MMSNDLSGGETIAAITLAALGLWMAWPHVPELHLWAAHVSGVACQLATDLRG